ERGADLVLPASGGGEASQATVLASSADLVAPKGAFVQRQPLEAVEVMIEVVVDAGIRRRGHDEIDRARGDVAEAARVGDRDLGDGDARRQASLVVAETRGELFGLLREQRDGEAR